MISDGVRLWLILVKEAKVSTKSLKRFPGDSGESLLLLDKILISPWGSFP